ncbi:MAG: RNA polymerase sigma factor [Propionibacteriaceae bacterium]
MRRPRRGDRDRRPAPDGSAWSARAAAVLAARRGLTVSPEDAAAAIAGTIARERLRIVATLIRTTGDWELAEDCVQDAVERALVHWPTDGVPDNPGAWLTTTARRRALDVLRRRVTERDKLREVMIMAEPGPTGAGPDPYGDDRLRLIFTCCHPALPLAGRVALTLKTVAGLSTGEVARAFLTTEATMSQRLLRAKTKIKNAGVPYRVPPPHRLVQRTSGVLAVVYLVFNAGYGAAAGDGLRDDLAAEAVRPATLLTRLLPDDEETFGLLALLLLQQSRRAARTDAAGDLVPMAEQDRTRWDVELIASGLAALERARQDDRPLGSYRLQAEIAACHVTAFDAASTDWPRVVALYDALLRAQPSPVIRLNRAVAIAFRDGPAAGLTLVDGLVSELPDYPVLPAVRADLLHRLGRRRQASTAYRQASELAPTAPERRYLRRRLAELGQP